MIVLAPEALLSEGIAMNALEEALGAEPFGGVADALADLGVGFDPLGNFTRLLNEQLTA